LATSTIYKKGKRKLNFVGATKRRRVGVCRVTEERKGKGHGR